MHLTECDDTIGGQFVESPIPSKFCQASANAMQNEIANTIANVGITLKTQATDTTHDQLQMAIANYVQNGNFYKETGASTGSAYILERINLPDMSEPHQYGMFMFLLTNTSVGSSTAQTIQLPNMAAKPLVRLDGTSNPRTYDLVAGQIAHCLYDPALDKVLLVGSYNGYRQLPLPGIVTLEANMGTNGPHTIDQYVIVAGWAFEMGQKSIPTLTIGGTNNSLISVPPGRYLIFAILSFDAVAAVNYHRLRINIAGFDYLGVESKSEDALILFHMLNTDSTVSVNFQQRAGVGWSYNTTESAQCVIVRLDDYIHDFNSDVGNG